MQQPNFNSKEIKVSTQWQFSKKKRRSRRKLKEAQEQQEKLIQEQKAKRKKEEEARKARFEKNRGLKFENGILTFNGVVLSSKKGNLELTDRGFLIIRNGKKDKNGIYVPEDLKDVIYPKVKEFSTICNKNRRTNIPIVKFHDAVQKMYDGRTLYKHNYDEMKNAAVNVIQECFIIKNHIKFLKM